jgi:uroporphyrinogen-III synthase
MRLLVTRPEQDAIALKAQLIGLGHEVLIEPMIHIEYEPLDELDLADAQALIATSRNALRALAQSRHVTDARALPLYAVGPGTSATARALGFELVLQGPKDAAALIGFVAEHAEVYGGPLVYLAGEVRAADVGGELRRLGFHVLEPVAYRARASDRLSRPIAARFEAGEIDGVLLMSPQTARTYVRLIRTLGLGAKAGKVMHYCLSPAVARALDPLAPVRRAAAAEPNMQSLLALVAQGVPHLP